MDLHKFAPNNMSQICKNRGVNINGKCLIWIPKNRDVNNLANVAFTIFAPDLLLRFYKLGYICKEQICAKPFFVQWKTLLQNLSQETPQSYINNKEQKHVVTCATGTSISRVSRLTGTIMRSLGIITDSIDITVMGVNHTLVNTCEGKLPT